jgi:hypothetical protein
VFSVFFIQVKSSINQNGSGDKTETDANPLADACHEHYYKDDEHSKQSACENKQVLTF